jgi:lipopolysaccharide biosynthesis regulator YciM
MTKLTATEKKQREERRYALARDYLLRSVQWVPAEGTYRVLDNDKAIQLAEQFLAEFYQDGRAMEKAHAAKRRK